MSGRLGAACRYPKSGYHRFMVEFLVTSKVRRRLLTLLWSEGVSGNATELAERAGVGFASAYRELQKMRRLDLVLMERRNRGATFSANRRHPSAAALGALFNERMPARDNRSDDST